MTISLASPLSYPLHPGSWKRPVGSIDYRVTNPFTGPDFLNGGMHRATDVGNFRTGDAVRSPASCRGIGRRHTDGALGVIFDLGHGITVQLWHLNRVDIPSDRWTQLARGQAVGVTGNTGARLSDGKGGTVPMPMHTHISAERNGTPFDVEPHLPMPERPAQPIELESDVNIPPGLQPLAIGVVAQGNRLRRDPRTTADARVLEQAYQVQVYGFGVAGETYTIGGQSSNRYAWVGQFGETWYVAEPLLGGLRSTAYTPSDCAAQEAVIAQLTNRIDAARTANTGARQAQEAVEVALR